MELNPLMEHSYLDTYLLVAINQDMLLFKLLSFWGVLLTQVCYCLRLYSNWIDSRNLHFLNKRKSTTRFQSLTWLLFYKLGSLGSFLSSMVVVKVMVVESFILCYPFNQKILQNQPSSMIISII